jgi:glycosyltransferase involved in cell wall biosynthesis
MLGSGGYHDGMSNKNSPPLVSIGMPVYNEGKFLREALGSLLSQTYQRTEMLISDNGSTDNTERICREMAKKDNRITYIKHPKNMGQHENFNYLPRASQGTYFFWASGHDLWSPKFVEDSVRTLEKNPHIVLVYPRTINIREDGTETREIIRSFDIRHMSPQRRFCEVMWRVDCNYVYGMWRLQPMLKSKLFQRVVALDRIFLAEMAVKGTFLQVNTIKYCRGNRPGKHTELENRHRTMSYLYPGQKFTDEELSGGKYYHNTRTHFYRVVQDASFLLPVRWLLYANIWLCGVMKYHLFPGAACLSTLTKVLLPKPILRWLMEKMQ